MLQQAGGRGKDQVRRGRADDQQFDFAGLDPGGLKRRARRALGQIAGGLAFGGDVALADAGARRDPLVARVDEFLQIGVGEYLLRQETAGTGNACVNQSAAPRMRSRRRNQSSSLTAVLSAITLRPR
jgi:hypothetical protein